MQPIIPDRVLFVAEAVTLAHVARPVALARGLARKGFEPIVATDPRYAAICPGDGWPTETIRSIPTAQFLGALSKGTPVYDLTTLRAYVEEDLALLRRTQPSIVVGDFRLSLSVSARLLKIPYINVTNAYWSPYARPEWHAPALPWTRHLPAALSDLAFRAARPLAFRLHARPMEALRREHGMPSLGFDLLRVYTDGDITLYADTPELVPLFDAPRTHRHLGPVAWSPSVPLPAWWGELEPGPRLIYVTLGSSGSAARLPGIVRGLARLGRTVVVATATPEPPPGLPEEARVAAYLPGDLVAQRSDLVVCNGGSPTSHQALAHGVPVLALPANLDQFLNSAYVAAAGAGEWLRPEAATAETVERVARRMLAARPMRLAAAALARSAAMHDPADTLAGAIAELLG